MTASGQDSAPRNSLRGSTRGTGEWHIYTAIYDERKSEMFVDGYCEASAKNVGSNKLDGLSYSCAPTLPTAPAKTGRASFSCAPRFGGGGAAAAAALRTAEY